METILRKSFKNLFAIVLSTVVALSVMVTSAFALATADTVDVTVDQLEENTEVKIYKIIDVNWDEANQQPKAPVYTWNDDFVAGVDKKFIVEGTTNELNPKWSTVSNPTIFNQLEKLADTAATKTAVKELNSLTVTSVNTKLPMGEYLIVAKSATKIYKPTTVAVFPKYVDGAWKLVATAHVDGNPVQNSITVKMKGEAISKPDKTITEQKPEGYQVGDTVTYKIDNLVIPSYSSNETNLVYVISDTMSDGLTFNADSLKVNVGGEYVVASPTTYTVKTGAAAAPATFKVEFAQEYIRENASKKVVLTYSATVNEKAVKFDSTKNTVKVEFNNNTGSGTGSQTDEVTAFTYGFEATKKHNANDPTGLAGAEFTLKLKDGSANLKFTRLADGSYVLAANQADSNATETLVVSSTGKLKVVGLKLGTYVLTETKAPAGYILAKNPIEFTLVDNALADGTLDVCTITNPNTEAVDADVKGNNIFEFDVFNLKDGEIELPNTGGMGTVMFTVGGIVLMAGAAFFLIASNRKERE